MTDRAGSEHNPPTVIDADEFEAACRDPKTRALVEEARAYWEMRDFNAGVQALLGVLNDIGGGNPWNYNVITEAAEDALRAALKVMGHLHA